MLTQPRTLYFAYGANINIDDMAYRCPKAEPVGAFELYDWQLEMYSHATIELCKNSSVHGVLWSITPDCEASLDAFEGFPTYYTKRFCSQNGYRFFFYVMEKHRTGTPSQGYINRISDGYFHWKLPYTQLEAALDRTYALQNRDFQYQCK